jgi:hypothetical protein
MLVVQQSTELSKPGCDSSMARKPMAKASYLSEMAVKMQEEGIEAWWEACPFCGYEGPEPPLPGLEPIPGHHEVILCPACRGRLEGGHLEVVRVRTREPEYDVEEQ